VGSGGIFDGWETRLPTLLLVAGIYAHKCSNFNAAILDFSIIAKTHGSEAKFTILPRKTLLRSRIYSRAMTVTIYSSEEFPLKPHNGESSERDSYFWNAAIIRQRDKHLDQHRQADADPQLLRLPLPMQVWYSARAKLGGATSRRPRSVTVCFANMPICRVDKC
jgi:hypothetical protein